MAAIPLTDAGGAEVRHLPVRRIRVEDLRESLEEGFDDFWSRPSHYAILALVYPLIGIALGLWTSGSDALPVLYPLVMGFALVGPVAALGFYEISRRREEGADASWSHAFEVLRSPSMPGIAGVSLILALIFLVWLGSAQALHAALLPAADDGSYREFLGRILTTREGWTLIVLGNLLGLVFAILAFSLSVVSLPLLLDRDIGFATAVATSLRAVRENLGVMALWGLIVTVLLLIGMAPLFVGLGVVVPVLGHATWHLYRRVVDAEGGGNRNPMA